MVLDDLAADRKRIEGSEVKEKPVTPVRKVVRRIVEKLVVKKAKKRVKR
jgi:hypothetical protein